MQRERCACVCVFVCLRVRALQDIVDSLQGLGLIKYWRGTHLIHADPKLVQEHWARYHAQKVIDVDSSCLHWQPLPQPAVRKRP